MKYTRANLGCVNVKSRGFHICRVNGGLRVINHSVGNICHTYQNILFQRGKTPSDEAIPGKKKESIEILILWQCFLSIAAWPSDVLQKDTLQGRTRDNRKQNERSRLVCREQRAASSPSSPRVNVRERPIWCGCVASAWMSVLCSISALAGNDHIQLVRACTLIKTSQQGCFCKPWNGFHFLLLHNCPKYHLRFVVLQMVPK